ncbi:SGNH/GDSL hydrolase family protein [Mixta intestinalis]|uniref:Rhamnogalacturonan acetylesterase RhgT n=1 Tax=Mixta intestinalis TaxID=1615494 RepID=A0A6P1Q0K0_9GAMM|nr:SGNH/GDSL hydrolase family protein [Mixta intestinalis]QHM71794.1 Rhamnogalacturonan acetylesterase RhgT [Mixta intestinalis]
MNFPVKNLTLLCALPAMANAATLLQGMVVAEVPFADAQVSVIDSNGKQLTTTTAADGRYSLEVDTLTPPFTLSAMNSALPEGGTSIDCINSDIRRARCMASLLLNVKQDGINTANITPFTDRMVTEVASKLGYIGPQQWVERGTPAKLNAELLTAPLANFRAGMQAALQQLGMRAEQIDPISTPVQPGDGMTRLLSVINHTRGYDNNSGEASGAVLTDIAFRPIAGLEKEGAWEPLDLQRALNDRQAILQAKTRILIVSDSTAATYEVQRLPRMGWGQVFQQQFRDDSDVVVLNGARAGRSSRDFYNEGWYHQMGRFLQPGDYIFIAHGHNDENCNGDKPLRGTSDVKNLCTYPNDAQGKPQHPEGRPDMSFQHSLERYINLAREAGATPVLFTPTTRVKNAAGKIAFQQGPQDVVVSSHVTKNKPGYRFSGDYVATIRQTASRNSVPLIELERETIAFANAHAHDWMDYWLAVDPNDPRYPWYKTQKAGIRSNPDATHFQQKGAEAVAAIVAEQIRQNTALNALADKLKP